MTNKEKTEFFCRACIWESNQKIALSTMDKAEKSKVMIHFDICGSINVKTMDHARYFLLFNTVHHS